MTSPLQLHYPVVTLDNKELLPAGALLTPETMAAVVGSSRSEVYPCMRLMEYGTIAQDLQDICLHPPYDRIFSNKQRKRAVFDALHQVEFIQPLLDIYGFFKKYAPYTYRHILTVYALSLRLAQKLIEDPLELSTVVQAAPHHDFGKVCVPLSVWKKSTRLTDEERRHLSHHAVAGYVLLSYYYQDAAHPAAIAARDHHERNDGSGYPRGIQQRSLIVEIVAVCDLFDALISPRPYRPCSYDLRTALDEITQLAFDGKISDDVVRALITVNRGGMHSYRECTLSSEMRGTPPADNLYRGGSVCELSVTGDEECRKQMLDNVLMDV